MIFVNNLPFPKRKGYIIDHILEDDLMISSSQVPKGTNIKIGKTENFGWIVLPQEDINGQIIRNRIHKY